MTSQLTSSPHSRSAIQQKFDLPDESDWIVIFFSQQFPTIITISKLDHGT